MSDQLKREARRLSARVRMENAFFLGGAVLLFALVIVGVTSVVAHLLSGVAMMVVGL